MWIMVQHPAEPNAVSMKMSPTHLKYWNKPLILCGVKTRSQEERRWQMGCDIKKTKLTRMRFKQTMRRKILHMCIGT